MRMVQRRDRPRFALEALAGVPILPTVRWKYLDGDRAIEPGVARFVDFPHDAGTDTCRQLVRSNPLALEVGRGDHLTDQRWCFRPSLSGDLRCRDRLRNENTRPRSGQACWADLRSPQSFPLLKHEAI